MRAVKLIVLLTFMAVPAAVEAQDIANAGIGIFGGLAMPMGDFAEDDNADEESGYAEMGFMLGADAYLPLGSTSLGWVTSASVNSFGVDADEAVGPDGDAGRYLLIPIMTGASMDFALSPSMIVSPMAQVGVNIAMGPSLEDAAGNEYNLKTSFSLAFSAGANVTLTEAFGATVRYVNGGAPEREFEVEGGGDFEKDSPMSFLQLGVIWRMR